MSKQREAAPQNETDATGRRLEPRKKQPQTRSLSPKRICRQLLSLLLGILLSTLLTFAQEEGRETTERNRNHTLYKITTLGSCATGEQTPFWIVNHQYGKVPLKANNALLQVGLLHSQPLNSQLGWRVGATAITVTPRERNFYIQELFTELSYKKMRLSIGSKEQYDLSTLDHDLSSGDLAHSPNARPIPEINLAIPTFTTIPYTKGWLKIRGDFAVGRSFDRHHLRSITSQNQDFVEEIRWHHKSLFIKIEESKQQRPLSLLLGVRHIAQWGGRSTNPSLGHQPSSLKDFLRIIMGKSGDENASLSDQVNVLGNHFGTYDLQLGYKTAKWELQAYYQHYFEDRSGMELFNLWDGLKGVRLYLHRGRWVRKIVVEQLSTLDQSGPAHFIQFDHGKYPGYGGGADNYYNNVEYITGASYFSRAIGSPFLLSPEYNRNGSLEFKHNRIYAWHFGMMGELTPTLTYRLQYSKIQSFGTHYEPTTRQLSSSSLATHLTYTPPKHQEWRFSLSIAGDRGTLLGNQAGVSFSITREGFIRKR